MRAKMTHNNRTAEFTYRAPDRMGHRVANLIRDRYGKLGYKVTTDRADNDIQMLAITNLKWAPVPNKIQREIPCLIEGFLLGYDSGYLQALANPNPMEIWDKAENEKMDIHFSTA